jgi:hypothetical protein
VQKIAIFNAKKASTLHEMNKEEKFLKLHILKLNGAERDCIYVLWRGIKLKKGEKYNFNTNYGRERLWGYSVNYVTCHNFRKMLVKFIIFEYKNILI